VNKPRESRNTSVLSPVNQSMPHTLLCWYGLVKRKKAAISNRKIPVTVRLFESESQGFSENKTGTSRAIAKKAKPTKPDIK